jgi:foldase protein PrsA
MNKRRRSVFVALCFVIALVMTASLAACDDENAGGTGRVEVDPVEQGGQAGEDENAGNAGSGGENEVLAVAVGQDITRKQVDDICAFMAMSYGMSLDTMSESDRTLLSNQMLIYLADNVIIKNYVDGYDKEAAEKAKTSADQQLEMITTQSPGIEEQLSSAGISVDTVKAYLETQYYQGALYEKVAEEQPVTDEEAQKYYDENKAKYVTPESIGLSHILIMDEELTDANRTSMEAIRQRALGGEDFAELAKQYSADGSASSGGALGIVTRGEMVTPFEEAGFKLKKGEISEVVETQYGFHIIKADTDLVPEQQMSLEAARTQVDSAVASEHFYAEVDKLKKEHPVKYNVEVDPATGEPPLTAPETPASADSGAASEDAGEAGE